MMKPAVFIGVVLIVLSIFSFAYRGLPIQLVRR